MHRFIYDVKMMSDLRPPSNINFQDDIDRDVLGLEWDEDSLYGQCSELLHQSRIHLMLREFSECINLCNQGIRNCSQHSPDKLNCCFEGFVILAVQAYGEQNLWREVLPFIDAAYGDIQKCPPTIIKICIGLLSWVGEHSLAQKQACLWLEESSNKENIEQHTDVGRVVLEKVLIPQKRYNEIHSMLGKLDGMMDLEKDSIRKWIDRMHIAMDQRRAADKNEEAAAKFKKEISQSLLLTILLRMRNFLSLIPPLMKHSVGKAVFFGLSFYFVFLHFKMNDGIFGSTDITRTLFQIYTQHFKR